MLVMYLGEYISSECYKAEIPVLQRLMDLNMVESPLLWLG